MSEEEFMTSEENKASLKNPKEELNGHKKEVPLEATLSTLVLSIASSATISMGLVPHPNTNQIKKNIKMAAFNIDLLLLLEKKTKNNLLDEEKKFLRNIISDLQMKFIQIQDQKQTSQNNIKPEKTN